MTDAPTPEDLDAAPEAIDPEAIAKEAQEKFSLVDLLDPQRNSKILATKKSLVYRDIEAVDAYNAANSALSLMKQALLSLTTDEQGNEIPLPEGAQERYAAGEVEIAAQEEVVERAKIEMLKSALAFHLRAYPNVAIKRARMEARRIFRDPATKDWYETVQPEELQDFIDEYLFGDALQKVVDAEGQEVSFGVPKHELGTWLSENLHPAVWRNLQDDVTELLIRSGIARASVEEPGF